jgi:hypothetical protein
MMGYDRWISVHTVDQSSNKIIHTTIAISSGVFCPLTIHLLLGLELRCQLVTSLLQGHLQLPLPGIEGGVRRVRVCGGGGGDAGGCIYLFAREEAVGDEIFNMTNMAQSQHVHRNSHSSLSSNSIRSLADYSPPYAA